MIVKVCGMRDGENIRQVAELGVDWIGMIFYPQSPRNVTMIPSHAGISRDRGSVVGDFKAKRVGVFVDEMAQNVVTRVVNFKLDMVQFHGHETPTLIRNLRRTIGCQLIILITKLVIRSFTKQSITVINADAWRYRQPGIRIAPVRNAFYLKFLIAVFYFTFYI